MIPAGDGPFPDQSAFADGLRYALLQACPGSSAQLRGSLAAGRGDAYSDVDLLWVVPDGRLDDCLAELPTTLSPVARVVSVRSDPDFQRSALRRLIFVRFAGVPLFWRLDLELWAASRAGDETADIDNPLARGTDWSLAESATMNAIAAIKAVRRGRLGDADGLLARGFERLDSVDPGGDWVSGSQRWPPQRPAGDPALRSSAPTSTAAWPSSICRQPDDAGEAPASDCREPAPPAPTVASRCQPTLAALSALLASLTSAVVAVIFGPIPTRVPNS